MHGSFTSSVGHAVGGALPMALGAIPGVGSAAGFAGMGMQQAMNSWGGGGGGPGQQDDGFRQSGFDHSHRGPDEEGILTKVRIRSLQFHAAVSQKLLHKAMIRTSGWMKQNRSSGKPIDCE